MSLNTIFFKFIKKEKNIPVLRPFTLVRPRQAVSHVAVSKKTYIFFSKIRSATVLGVHCAGLAMDRSWSPLDVLIPDRPVRVLTAFALGTSRIFNSFSKQIERSENVFGPSVSRAKSEFFAIVNKRV